MHCTTMLSFIITRYLVSYSWLCRVCVCVCVCVCHTQFASSFGAVPREYRLLLAGLEDRAIPRPYPVVQAALERELAAHGGMSVFKDFDETATAAASLAQVCDTHMHTKAELHRLPLLQHHRHR